MAQYEENIKSLKGDRTVVLRHAVPSDAQAVVEFSHHAAETGEFLIMLSHEIKDTKWSMKKKLKDVLADPSALHLLAVFEGEVVGYINTFGQKRSRLRHAIEFGIAITPSWQGCGLGRVLISELLTWAKANPNISRVALHVHSKNKAAIGLYESLGFEHEGYHKNAIRYEDGSFMDDLTMAQMV